MTKFPEDFVPVTGYVEDPKVYTCFCQKVEKTKAVTHAYYRALEEEHSELDAKYEKALSDLFLARADLAALRVRVGALVDASTSARRELQSCQAVIHLHGGFDPAYVEGAQKAMRGLSAALEALK